MLPTNNAVKKISFLVLFTFLFLFILHCVFYTSILDISISNSDNGTKISYKILNQQGKGLSESMSKSAHLRKFIHEGSYEVQVIQGNKSYLRIAKTKGLLNKYVIKGDLVQQKSRVFIGNNPESCTQYIDGVLISYACQDYYSNIKIHVPANASTPTYTMGSPGSGIGGFVQGFASVNGKSIALIQDQGQDVEPFYAVAQVNNDLSTSKFVILPGIDPKKSYFIKNYKAGFLIYDSNLRNAYYYPSLESSPQTIALGTQGNTSLNPSSLSVGRDDSIIALYSSDNDLGSKAGQSEVIVYNNAGKKDFRLHGGYSSAYQCNVNRLCLVGSNTLDVYDTGGGAASKLFSIDNVVAAINTNKGLLVVNKTGIINLDSNNASGFYEYTFGDYKFNSIQPANEGYILALTNNKSRRIALYINENNPDKDSIDQKIESLQKIPEVNNISIYDKYIYIT